MAFSLTKLYGLWLMSRPLILPSGVLAYAVGVVIAAADGPVAWQPQAVGLALTMLANLAAHYADEYADADTDALARHTGMSGGSGAIAAGFADRALALQAALVVSLLTILSGVWAVITGTIPVVAGMILVLGLLGGWLYSVPPIALERRGWGELTNALLGGCSCHSWLTPVRMACRHCGSTFSCYRWLLLHSSVLSVCTGQTGRPMLR